MRTSTIYEGQKRSKDRRNSRQKENKDQEVEGNFAQRNNVFCYCCGDDHIEPEWPERKMKPCHEQYSNKTLQALQEDEQNKRDNDNDSNKGDKDQDVAAKAEEEQHWINNPSNGQE